jgi:hypothetical protein
MNVIDKIAHYQQVWRMSLPHLAVPLPKDIRYWVEIDPQIVEATILQASARFAASRIDDQFDVTLAYRWVTGTAHNRIKRAKEAEIQKLREVKPVLVPAQVTEQGEEKSWDNRGNR